MINLKSNTLSVGVLPEIGGCIETFELTLPGQPAVAILSAPSLPLTHAGDAKQSAHFLMLPYVNRLRGNEIRCEDSVFNMLPNTSEPLALHGVGWQLSWQVLETGADFCELGCSAPVGYPIQFHARQKIGLSDDTLLIDVSITNTSDFNIPVGAGFHPYFPRDDQTKLQFAADYFWLEGPGHMPTDCIRVPPELSFDAMRPLPDKWRANCYTGWNGRALIEQPSLGYDVVMTASPNLPDLMFYTPLDVGFFALEPQSHTAGHVDTSKDGSPATPMVELEPGVTFAVWMKLQVTPRTTSRGKND